jgi:hypothetical protein
LLAVFVADSDDNALATPLNEVEWTRTITGDLITTRSLPTDSKAFGGGCGRVMQRVCLTNW